MAGCMYALQVLKFEGRKIGKNSCITNFIQHTACDNVLKVLEYVIILATQ